MGGNNVPVGFGLQVTVGCCRTRITVINKDDMMPYKNLVLDGDTFTDKRMARYLAVAPYPGPFLDFDKCPNLRIVTNLTPIEVHKVVNCHVLTKLHIWCDTLPSHVTHMATRFPPALILICAASKIFTTRSPAAPSVMGFSPCSMQSRKCPTSTFRASVPSSAGAHMSPLR